MADSPGSQGASPALAIAGSRASAADHARPPGNRQAVAACWSAGAWRSIEPGITKTAPLMLSRVPMAGGLLGMNVPRIWEVRHPVRTHAFGGRPRLLDGGGGRMLRSRAGTASSGQQVLARRVGRQERPRLLVDPGDVADADAGVVAGDVYLEAAANVWIGEVRHPVGTHATRVREPRWEG